MWHAMKIWKGEKKTPTAGCFFWIPGSKLFRKAGKVCCVYSEPWRVCCTSGNGLCPCYMDTVSPEWHKACESKAKSPSTGVLLAGCRRSGYSGAAPRSQSKQILGNSHIHSLYKAIRARMVVFWGGIGPKECKQVGLSLKLIEEEFKNKDLNALES